MQRSRVALTALAAALLLTGAACTSGPDNGPNYSSVPSTPTPSATSSPAESPSPTGVPTTGPNVSPGEVAPTEPSGVNSRTSDGALAFLGYYYRLSDWAFATSQTDFLLPLFAPGCKACIEGTDNLNALFKDGQYVTGGRVTVKSVQLVENDRRSGAEYAATGVFSVSAATVRSTTGAVVRTFPANGSLQLTDWVAWSDGGWHIVDEGKV